MRVILFARINTSIDDPALFKQLKMLRAYCKSAGHTIVEEVTEARSGFEPYHEAQVLPRLVSRLERGELKADAILVTDLNRVSRNPETFGALVKRLSACRVKLRELHSLTSGHSDGLAEQLLARFDEMQSELI